MIDCALFIVSAEGELVYRNGQGAALLSAGYGGLRVTRGALGARSAKLGEALERAIALACSEVRSSGVCLPQPGKPPETWLRLAVAPIHFGGSSPDATYAAVWVLDGGSPTLPRDELLCALFGLSPAEARLARALLRGRTAGDYARQTGARLGTIRSQLHSIFVKTGARRQAQLVALLSRVPVLRIAGNVAAKA